MKSIPFKTTVLALLMWAVGYAQEFKTAVQEFKVGTDANVTVKASFVEIEIEEWNKNKVEVQGIMRVQGLSPEEAGQLFKNWNVQTEETDKGIRITSNSNSFDSENFFMFNDKYLGNIMVDIPMMTTQILDALDSMHFVLPEISEFSDLDLNYNFNFNSDAIAFDYEEFKKNSEYLQQWQERNKEELKRLKEELKANQAEMRKEQMELKEEMRLMAEEQRKEAQKIQKRPEKPSREMNEREEEIQKILEKRERVKVKKILRIKVPKNAKLEMDVDYCKISTI